jgi:hypothetical protein
MSARPSHAGPLAWLGLVVPLRRLHHEACPGRPVRLTAPRATSGGAVPGLTR